MARTTRRTFLKQSAALAGASFVIAGTKASGRVRGANDSIRVAVAGINGRGRGHIADLVDLPGVEVTYLVDPDSRLWESRSEMVTKTGASAPKTVADIREALDDPNVDAVSIATPNHWHSLMSIWALQAGKDVYVEKPCSHNIHEGRVLADLAAKSDRIVQHGTQRRSEKRFAGIAEFIASGRAGKLKVARGLCYKPRKSIGVEETKEPPKQLDFNLWLGPAAQQPYHENLVHYDWHWFWDFGNGDLGNQGVHQMDVALWGLGDVGLPRKVISLGGRFGYEDQGQTANTQLCVYDYGDAQLIFEVRGLETDDFHGEKIGNIFHCEEGIIAGSKFYPRGSSQGEPIPPGTRGPGESHFANFFEAVRSRRKEDLNAPIERGHYASALCHLANISYRLGERVPFNSAINSFGDNNEAFDTMERMRDHLGANHVPLAETEYTLGRSLEIDPQTERFVGDEQAAALLTREYRKGFELPA